MLSFIAKNVDYIRNKLLFVVSPMFNTRDHRSKTRQSNTHLSRAINKYRLFTRQHQTSNIVENGLVIYIADITAIDVSITGKRYIEIK